MKRTEIVYSTENNENIKEAKEKLDEISRDDIVRRMALKAEIERMDEEQRMYESRRDGRLEGEATGRVAGRIEAKLEDAKKMLEEGIEIEKIIKITGLERSKIEEIKNSL